jgi:CDGSH-type Zn-finger protein/uncharacterized Fe-S cluster protein YjdI
MSNKIDLAVNDREELIYLLSEAAEFEHAVMCTYLYAQWSLKRDESEGITSEEKQAIDRWRDQIRAVALEEMLHLALVNNLLASLGAAPHFSRPDFPIAQGHFPADVDLHLAPFSIETLRHFVYIERPEGIGIQEAKSFTHESHYPRAVCPDLLTPTTRNYSSQGHLYHGIAQAITSLSTKLGEKGLFVGHGESQLGSEEFPLPGLFRVSSVDSALRAIEEIVEQGEGAPAYREDSHYARFSLVYAEFSALQAARPEFEPAMPAAVNPILTEFTMREDVAPVVDPLARKVVDLGNAIYALMLQTMAQICAPAPLPIGLRQGLADVSIELMKLTTVLGEAAARLPLGGEIEGVNAGLSLALPRSFGQLVQANAAQIIGERAAELGEASRSLESSLELPGVTAGLHDLAGQLNGLHEEFEGRFRPKDMAASGSESAPFEPAPSQTSESASAGTIKDSDSDNEASTEDITIRFDTGRCIHSRHCVLNAPRVFLANVKGPWLHPEEDSVEHLISVAHSCPSGAVTYELHNGDSGESPPEVNVINVRQNGPYALHAPLRIDNQADTFRATLCRCGQSRNKPFCDNSHIKAGFQASGEPETVPSEPLDERGGELRVEPLKDGPLRVRGPMEICSGTGRTITRNLQVKLCRCGGSANKPFCDGTHQRIGFKSE